MLPPFSKFRGFIYGFGAVRLSAKCPEKTECSHADEQQGKQGLVAGPALCGHQFLPGSVLHPHSGVHSVKRFAEGTFAFNILFVLGDGHHSSLPLAARHASAGHYPRLSVELIRVVAKVANQQDGAGCCDNPRQFAHGESDLGEKFCALSGALPIKPGF